MISQKYLERLAGTCSHLASCGEINEEDAHRHFYRENLHIKTLSDYDFIIGKVDFKNKRVFHYHYGEEDVWIGEEPLEDMSENYDERDFEEKEFFYVKNYIPGLWEGLIRKLYDESLES